MKSHPLHHPRRAQDCYPEGNADYGGFALTWGLTYKLPSAAQCCKACKDVSARLAAGMISLMGGQCCCRGSCSAATWPAD